MSRHHYLPGLVQNYGSHEDLSVCNRSSDFLREDRRFSCDAAGYLEDDDSDSELNNVSPRRKLRHKQRHKPSEWTQTPSSPEHQDSFDEMFEYFTRACDIRLENEPANRSQRDKSRTSHTHQHHHHPHRRGLSNSIGTKEHPHQQDDVHKRDQSAESYFRKRSNTQPNISLNSSYLGVGEHRTRDGSRSPRLKSARSPMAACMPGSPPSSPWFTKRHHSFHSGHLEDIRNRDIGDTHGKNNNVEVSPNRVLCHMADQVLKDAGWEVGDMRPRVTSMPTRPPRTRRIPSLASLRAPNTGVHRVRSYVITSHGHVIKEGERYVSNSSVASTDSNISAGTSHSGNSTASFSHFRVIIIGQDGVGKRAIIQRFMVPDDGGCTTNSSLDDDSDKTVSILLDGEESTMEFIDVSDDEMDCYLSNKQADAYVIVYSVEDRESFTGAIDRLYEIRKEDGRSVAVILVANKADLVRTRVVAEEEGRSAAKTYDCKYIEVSAAIEHKVDDLLVGILKQIRLIRQRDEKSPRKSSKQKTKPEDSNCLTRARQNVLAKLLRSRKVSSKSCDNLYVL